MLFQTYEFFLLFIVTSLLLVLVKSIRARQMILLFASLFFYAWGSFLHTLLFLGVILWTYCIARAIEANRNRPQCKKVVFVFGIVVSFIPLFLYKYVPFFMQQVFPTIPVQLHFIANSMLPIGISFYTFQAVGYVIDVYRGDQKAETDFVIYSLFVSFFPQLVAGPIERASQLLFQLKHLKPFAYNNTVIGLRMMGIGLFMKIFVADTVGYIVDFSYNSVLLSNKQANPIMLLLATFAFGIQIYCDFNGYSMIAKGVAKSLGIELMSNFERPYFSKSITEFWRRWHRSLSYWFRDYVFVPLGGNRQGKCKTSLHLFITFFLSGIWHGANWTFAIWGATNGVLLIVEKWIGLNDKNKKGWRACIGWIYTYLLIHMAWVFFRANTLGEAFYILHSIFTRFVPELIRLIMGKIGLFDIVPKSGLYLWNAALSVLGVLLIFMYDMYEEKHGCFAKKLGEFPAVVRWAIYSMILFVALGFGKWGDTSQFIYFRF